ncbi:MAG: DUF5995 family protein [Candidatus Dojkabacteria bacterium]|nr:DUF5995 family protein [Candidatus Dojkabacteria bacterium]MDQ7020365.1 DUF5995 family protein [Candidatus Dojkabacteria bacterium]
MNHTKNNLSFLLGSNETVEDVVTKMNLLSRFFQSYSDLSGFIPFLETYKYVTGEVYLSRETFNSFPQTENLDIFFANLYFKPIYSFLTEGKMPLPWRTYLEYCNNNFHNPFLQVLIGICVHINSDLA